MKVIEQKVYKVTYKTNYSSHEEELIEANSLIEAIELSTFYHKKDSEFKIKGVNEYIPILKPISKTVTQTLTVEL